MAKRDGLPDKKIFSPYKLITGERTFSDTIKDHSGIFNQLHQ